MSVLWQIVFWVGNTVPVVNALLLLWLIILILRIREDTRNTVESMLSAMHTRMVLAGRELISRDRDDAARDRDDAARLKCLCDAVAANKD
jgi:hypothetical protein